MKVWPGQPYPLGAVYDGSGTNFSLFSAIARRVELCLFDDQGKETRVNLPEATGFCWHGYLPSVKPGQRYGYRVHGPWDPANGHRCNPAKLLIDPYAKAIEGRSDGTSASFPTVFKTGLMSAAAAIARLSCRDAWYTSLISTGAAIVGSILLARERNCMKPTSKVLPPPTRTFHLSCTAPIRA
jgi:hypothetical protein